MNGDKIVQIACKEVGTTESPANSNKTKYGKWFGWDGVAWCAIFVSWCYNKAGLTIDAITNSKGFAGCQQAVSYYRKKNRVTTDPQVGDLVFFDWNGDGRHDHVGIFIKWINKTTFQTVEGNTSLTNQSNGGEVMIRERKNKNVLFVHPKVLG
jgi:cell wall-associated NlpC family hydrolase